MTKQKDLKSFKWFDDFRHFLCTCRLLKIHVMFLSNTIVLFHLQQKKPCRFQFDLTLISCIVLRSSWLCFLLQTEWWISHKRVAAPVCATSTFSFSRLIHHSVILFPKGNLFPVEANRVSIGSTLVGTY